MPGNSNHKTNNQMTTTNINTNSFWNFFQKLFLGSKQLQIVALVLFTTLFIACNKQPNTTLASIKTPTGWGYTISHNDKIIIKQSIIPVIDKNVSFRSEKDALKVGQLVIEKLNNNLSPTITKNDLNLLSIQL